MCRWLIFFMTFCWLFFAPSLVLSGEFNAYRDLEAALEGVKIRLLILKHSQEQMANDDANMALRALRDSSEHGLDISNVGNYFINRNGKLQFVYWGYNRDLDQLKAFVSKAMKVRAEAGDTLILFTIGHGMGSGHLDNLGRRSDVMKVFASAAEENQQKTLWWQLSCHAAAGLPRIRDLTPDQQDFFSMVASSAPNEQSASMVQGGIMRKLFMAMTQKDSGLDADGDGVITAKELRPFLNKVERQLGDRLYAKSPDEPIFGGSWANLIPVVDRNNPQGQYPRDYIPLPRWY